MVSKYSKKQWIILVIFCAIYILSASCISLQGPFYPMVAERKGATATQYGMVFAVFSLLIFIISPFVGLLITKFGSVNVILSGLLITGITSIMFGFVDKINQLALFLGISVIIRILEATGFTMFRIGSISIICNEFSDNVQMAFASIEAFFLTGNLLGPVIGGGLFEIGGFITPFTVVGVLILIAGFGISYLPKDYPKENSVLGKFIFKMLQLPQVILGIVILFGTYFNVGFLLTTLEPHIKKLGLSPVEVGLAFFCNSLAIIISSMFWSKIGEKFGYVLIVCSISEVVIICGLILLGPAPYVTLKLSVFTCYFGLFLHGIGLGGEQIGGFSLLVKGARLAGLPENIQTYGIISTLHVSSVSLGHFTGSLFGGYVFDIFNFGWGSHFFMLYHLILFIGTMFYICFTNDRQQLHAKVNEKFLSSKEETVNYGSLE